MEKAPDVDLARRMRAVEEALQYIARNLATINANMAKMQKSAASVQKTQGSMKPHHKIARLVGASACLPVHGR
jgi:prefoldin subunit 5